MFIQSPAITSVSDFLAHPTVNTIILAVAGYFVKELAVNVKELRKDLESHKVLVAKEYVTKPEMDYAIKRHEDSLHDITVIGR